MEAFCRPPGGRGIGVNYWRPEATVSPGGQGRGGPDANSLFDSQGAPLPAMSVLGLQPKGLSRNNIAIYEAPTGRVAHASACSRGLQPTVWRSSADGELQLATARSSETPFSCNKIRTLLFRWPARRFGSLAACRRGSHPCSTHASRAGAFAEACATTAVGNVISWWQELVTGVTQPFIKDGYVTVPDTPGLGIELNEAVVKEHLRYAGYFEPNAVWDPTRPSGGPWPHFNVDGV